MTNTHPKTKWTLPLMTVLMVSFCWSSSAWANHEDEYVVSPTELVISSSTSTTSTTMVVFEYYVCPDIPGSCDVMTSSSRITSSTYHHRSHRISMFVQANAVSLQQGVALGGGGIVTDFARLLSVPASRDKAFAALLRRERKAIMPLISGNKDNLMETMTLMDTLFNAIQKDPALSSLVAG